MATISTHNGSAVRQAHNIRAKSCVEKEAHIDPNGVHEIWKHETLGHAYERIFGEACARYNEKQQRADRKIKSYLADVRADERRHECYEMIIGVYGEEVNDETSKQIMKRFVDTWAERNPNLEMIGAYYHADEEGKNPHVHIDYIPVAHGYKRGLEVQNGLVKAFGEMGIEKIGKDTAQILWERRENGFLESLCQEKGIKIEHPQSGKENVKHLHTIEYKAMEKAKTALKQKDKAEKHLEGLQTSIQTAKSEKLDALRERDEARADVDVQKAVKDAVKGFQKPLKGGIEVLSESPAKTTIFGKDIPATVTIKKSDYTKLEDLRRVATRAEQAAAAMEKSSEKMMEQAKIVRQNKIDSYEVAVDQRVQLAEEREEFTRINANRTVKDAQRSERLARQAEKDARKAQEQAEQQLKEVQAQLQRINDIVACVPEEWEKIKERTVLALECEELYYKAQNGMSDDRISNSFGRTYFKLSDGREVGYKGLLDAYKETCEEHGILHDKNMWEHQEKLERNRSHGLSR